MTEQNVNLLVRASVLASLARMYSNEQGVRAEEILWDIHARTGQRYPITDITRVLTKLASEDEVATRPVNGMPHYRLQLGQKGHAVHCSLAHDVAQFCAVV